MKTLKVSSYAAALVAVIGGLSASAATTSVGPVNVGPTVLDFNTTANIAKFNPALGTLTKVNVSFTSSLTGSLGGENVDQNNTSSQAQIFAQVTNTFTFPNANTLVGVTVSPTVTSGTLTTWDGTTDFGGTSGFLQSIGTTAGSGSQDYTDAATLAAFTGAGNVSMGVSTSTRFFTTFLSGAVVPGSQLLAEAKSITVTYTYTPPTVPEGEFPLAVAAVVGALGFWQYRRRIAKA